MNFESPFCARACLLGLVLAVATGCHTGRPVTSIGELADSRSTIAVNFAPHQSIHFVVNGRDSLFEDVSRLEGRVMSVRGDTLQLKLRDWRVGNLNYAFAPKGVDVQVAVITSTAVNVAEMRRSPAKTVGAVVVSAATIFVLGFVVFLAHLPVS